MPNTRSALALLLTLGAACATPSRQAPGPAADYDLLIVNGKVIDGTGNAWFYGDVAVRGDRIVRVAPRGRIRRAATARVIDAAGRVVAPGFIDIQSHSRYDLLAGDSRVVSKVTQGITTEIMGEGSSNAPANDATIVAEFGEDTTWRRIQQGFKGPRGFDAWLRAMEARGSSTNVGSFVGASTVRVYAKGEAQGAATPAELDTMRAVMRNAMEDGAFGLASALIYPPGIFASTEELVEVAKAMAPYGGVYITHMRSEAAQFLEAIDEAMRIGREGGVPVEIYHLKAAGRRNWPKAALAVAKIDSARAAGLDVSADMYAYVAGGTGLAACLPPWASADGKLLDNLRNAEVRARMKAEVLQERTAWENLCALSTPEGVMVAEFRKPENKTRFEGKRLSEIAAAMGKDWVDAVMDLTLEEEARIGALFFMASEENLTMQMRQPWIKFGTDAGGSDPDSATSMTHPRAYGNFARLLGKYVRDERVMALEEAVRKMTSAVANRLSIRDRGLLREGMYADIAIFDPAGVADRATYERPHQLSVGFAHVLVNGVEVVRDGRHTGAKPGRAVRGPGWKGNAQ
ncbi:MAG TPA: D-aminoacylase [Gemmatimonadaceae bacterium]|nr:D-aminoacylase [Gemmatimonadaceae bacterium]